MDKPEHAKVEKKVIDKPSIPSFFQNQRSIVENNEMQKEEMKLEK